MKYLFIGDSITEGFNTKLFLPNHNIVNIAVSGYSTVETVELLQNTDINDTYDKIFICIGTNDLARGRSVSEIVTNIIYIINFILIYNKNSKIYVQSIFPTRENLPRPNERIKELNKQLFEECQKINVFFINNFDEFIDNTGKLKEEFTEDGLHLTNLAYLKWAELIKKYLD